MFLCFFKTMQFKTTPSISEIKKYPTDTLKTCMFSQSYFSEVKIPFTPFKDEQSDASKQRFSRTRDNQYFCSKF